MPITFEQINAIPDPLPNNRHELRFPSIANSDGYALTLRHSVVSLPAATLGQIRVRILGHSVAFAGGVAHDNIMSVSFTEDSEGTVLRALISWLEVARNRDTASGGLKSEYAADGQLLLHDTMGNIVHRLTLHNMWPMSVNYPEMGEETGPATVEVQFSVDAVSLEMQGGNSSQHQTGKQSLKGKGSSFAYQNADPTSIDFGSSISNMSITGSNFNVRRALQLGAFQMNLLSQSVIPQNAFTVAKLATQYSSFFR